MPTITIEPTDDRLRRLREPADRAGVSPEELLRDGVARWLERPGDDFAEAAAHMLGKNAELDRRLA